MKRGAEEAGYALERVCRIARCKPSRYGRRRANKGAGQNVCECVHVLDWGLEYTDGIYLVRVSEPGLLGLNVPAEQGWVNKEEFAAAVGEGGTVSVQVAEDGAVVVNGHRLENRCRMHTEWIVAPPTDGEVSVMVDAKVLAEALRRLCDCVEGRADGTVPVRLFISGGDRPVRAIAQECPDARRGAVVVVAPMREGSAEVSA